MQGINAETLTTNDNLAAIKHGVLSLLYSLTIKKLSHLAAIAAIIFKKSCVRARDIIRAREGIIISTVAYQQEILGGHLTPSLILVKSS